jgi:hypothetical protein
MRFPDTRRGSMFVRIVAGSLARLASVSLHTKCAVASLLPSKLFCHLETAQNGPPNVVFGHKRAFIVGEQGFRNLRIINDDLVMPGHDFPANKMLSKTLPLKATADEIGFAAVYSWR